MCEHERRGKLCVPVELAELLHATLGPLADILGREGHSWSPMLNRVLREYTGARDAILTSIHGSSVLPEVAHHTFVASEKVCGMAHSAIREEEDFIAWDSEVGGYA